MTELAMIHVAWALFWSVVAICITKVELENIRQRKKK